MITTSTAVKAPALIRVTDICRRYSVGKNSFFALDNVSLTVNKGEFVCVTGSSGSGKSTLMNILGLLDTPDSGSYFFEELNVSELSDRELCRIRNRKIGFVFQSFNLIPGLDALENVCLPLEYRGISLKERIALGKAALDAVGLSHRIHHKPSELSGGQQQRVAVARAIASAPELILADEPCGNLDSRSSGEIMKLLSNLNKSGKTVLLITHDKEDAVYADTIYRITDGVISKSEN